MQTILKTHYPTDFKQRFLDLESLKSAYSQVLLNNYFVHFAGNQTETSRAFTKEVLQAVDVANKWHDLKEYINSNISAKALR